MRTIWGRKETEVEDKNGRRFEKTKKGKKETVCENNIKDYEPFDRKLSVKERLTESRLTSALMKFF